jgi:hypothetical protein
MEIGFQTYINEHLEHAPISLNFKISILLNFQQQNYSKFNSPCTICLNITSTPLCTPTHCGLSNGIKNIKGGYGVCHLQDLNKTRQANNLP